MCPVNQLSIGVCGASSPPALQQWAGYHQQEVVTQLRTRVTMLFKQNFREKAQKLFGRQCQFRNL